MALNGSVSTNAGEAGRYYRLDWEVKDGDQSVINCTSKITWKLYACGYYGHWVAERTLYVIIDGTYVFNKSNRVERQVGSTDLLIASDTITLQHNNSTGKKSFTVSLGAAVYYTTVTCTGSKSFSLNDIPRASIITASDGTLEVKQNIGVTKYASNYTHTLEWSSGTYSGVIATKDSGTSYEFTPQMELANGAPNGTRVYCELTLKTYSGSTLIGTTKKAIYLAIPETVIPSCSLQVTDVDGHVAMYGGYVQGRSRINIVNTPTTVYSSPIEAYAISAEGKLYSDSSLENVVLSSSGTVAIKGQVRDKRGRYSDLVSVNVNVLAYEEPKIVSLSVNRCDQNGVEDMSGAYVCVTYSASITPLNDNNDKVLQIKYKRTSDDAYEVVDLPSLYSSNNLSTILPADDASPYEIRLCVSDAFTDEPISVKTYVSTGYTIAHISADGRNLAIGKVSEEKGFEVALASHFYNGITMDIPVLYTGDCDTILDSGQYYVGSNGTNKPGDGLNGWLTVQTYGESKDYCHQSYATYTGIRYERFRNDGVWGAWSRIWSSTSLFANNDNSSDDIVLSDSVSNYEMIDILYKSNDNVYDSVRVYGANGKLINLTATTYTGGHMYVKSRIVRAIDTTIEQWGSYYGEVDASGSNSGSAVSHITITQVIGWK